MYDLNLFYKARLRLQNCDLKGFFLIIVEFGGIPIQNYTIIAIFEVNMMILLPEKYTIDRAEDEVNIVF